MPASAEPMAKVKEIVRFRLMPMSWAAPISSETARMALPSLVFWTMSVRAAIATIVTRIVSSAALLMVTEPSEILPGTMGSMLFVSEPKSSCAPFSSRKEIPMAVISRLRRGALRSGV